MRYDLGAALTGLVFIVLGVAFMLDALDVADLRFEIILPIVAIVVGIGAITSSVVRSGRE